MKEKLITLVVSLALAVGLLGLLPAPRALAATTYYSTGSVAPNTLANWRTNRDGTGTSPANFTSGDVFVIQNGHNMTTSAAWTASGTGAKIQVESGGTLAASHVVSIPTFEIENGGKYIHNTGSAVVPGTTRLFAANSTYEIQNQGTSAITTGITWGNVVINLQTDPGQAIGNSAAYADVRGNFTVLNTQGREYRFTNAQADAHNILGNLDLQGGTLKFKSGTNAMTVTIGGSVSVSSGATLIDTSSGAVTTKVGGNWSNSGTFTAGTSTVVFNGSLAQTIGGTATTTFNSLTVDSSAGVTLGNTVIVNGALGLTNGLLALGNNTLTLGSSASVSGSPDASKMVVTDVDGNQTGKLCKVWGSGAFTYPIGDARGTAEYSPVSFTPTSPSGLTVCFRAVDDVHPDKPATPTTDYLTRYWSGTTSAGSFTGYTGVFTFINTSSDVVGSTANMLPKRWTGAFPWQEQNNVISGATFTWNGGSTLSDFTAFRSGVLAVTLAEFYAQQVDDHVLVTWETASELGNMGFNLFRGTSPAGWDRQLNGLLIPSQSLGNPGGFVYTWEDAADLVPGTTYYYWLQDVDVNGATTLHGPVSVDFVTPTAVTLGSLSASAGLDTLRYPTYVGVGALLALLAAAVGLRRRRV